MERTVGASLTVPDETMTIRQIVEKNIRGQRIPETLYRDPVYQADADHDSYDLEKVPKLDLAEKDEIRHEVKERIHQFEKDLEREKKQREESEALKKSQKKLDDPSSKSKNTPPKKQGGGKAPDPGDQTDLEAGLLSDQGEA